MPVEFMQYLSQENMGVSGDTLFRLLEIILFTFQNCIYIIQ